jgi:hypothetical protein
MNLHLPSQFCWTRFGSEAGQSIEQILSRKDQERSANNGVFLWGVGNAVGPGMKELVRRCSSPEVLFSPILGKARRDDLKPESVVAWTLGETHDGEKYPLPSRSLVTSRQSVSSPKSSHYALVCFSREPLVLCSPGYTLAFDTLRNIASGSPVGASQVTAVVARGNEASTKGRVYEVTFRADLVQPYFIRLRGPMTLPASADPGGAWTGVVEAVWNDRVSGSQPTGSREPMPL